MLSLVIHGGAGVLPANVYTSEEIGEYKACLKESLRLGFSVLKDKGSAMDAVVAAVQVLEDSPLFNAGRGSVLNSAGDIQMDASIMCGATGRCGGVTLVEHIKNPILAAKMVMTKTPHRLLGGRDLEALAQKHQLEFEQKNYFKTERRAAQLREAQLEGSILLDHDNGDNSNTVGAVALDHLGNLAAGTSTGGMTNKFPGRISDSSIIGAGTYANNETLAVSGTGTGDVFIQNVSCFDAHALMLYSNLSLTESCNKVLEKLRKAGGHGGLIALNTRGEAFLGFNTGGMFRGLIQDNGRLEVSIS